MGLFDHLFPPAASGAALPPTDSGEVGPDNVPSGAGTQFLHPKPPPPRLAPALLVPAQGRAAHPSSAPALPILSKPNLNPTPAAPQADHLQRRELVLTVGEILPHLPTEAIKPGLHDADGLVRFDTADLSADIGRGRATILLSKLADLCPDLVYKPGAELVDQAIRLPLQKLVEQLNTSKPLPEAERPTQIQEHPPKVSVQVQEPVPAPSSPAVPLVETHGDLLGHAAPPVWLEPVKKARAQAKAARLAEEGKQGKAGSAARGRRFEAAKPASPPTPLAKTFAKRKSSQPALKEAAETRDTDESATGMDFPKLPVSARISLPEALAAEAFSCSTPVASTGTVEIEVPEAVLTEDTMPPVISTPRLEAEPSGMQEQSDALTTSADHQASGDAAVGPVLDTATESHTESSAFAPDETMETAQLDTVEASLPQDPIPTDFSTPLHDGEHGATPDEPDEPDALVASVDREIAADASAFAGNPAPEVLAELPTSAPEETMEPVQNGALEATLSQAPMPPEVSMPYHDGEHGATPEKPGTLVADAEQEHDVEVPALAGDSAFENHAESPTDEAPEYPELTGVETPEVPASASPFNSTAAMVTESSNDPQPTPEAPRVEPSTSELSEVTAPTETKAHTMPSPSREETFPVIPTPPRIRPPAPPPPVLVTPAAGLREAISQSSVGESSATLQTGQAQSPAGIHGAPGRPLSTTYPHSDVSRPWAQTTAARETEDHEVSRKDASPAASEFPAYRKASQASAEVTQGGGESAPSSGSIGVKPPPIQFPATAFAATASVPPVVPESPEELPTTQEDHMPPVPIPAPVSVSASALPPQESAEYRSPDQQPSSGYSTGPSPQMPLQSTPPTSLVAARPAATVAVTSSSMPSRSLALFNQENLQALFMTEELLDVSSLTRHVAALPGISACALFAGDEAAQAGEFPPDFDLEVLREMGVQFVSSANVFGGRLLGREVENVTIQGGGFSVTLFARAGLCLCVVHRARGFLPGVREKLAAVADELAKGA